MFIALSFVKPKIRRVIWWALAVGLTLPPPFFTFLVSWASPISSYSPIPRNRLLQWTAILFATGLWCWIDLKGLRERRHPEATWNANSPSTTTTLHCAGSVKPIWKHRLSAIRNFLGAPLETAWLQTRVDARAALRRRLCRVPPARPCRRHRGRFCWCWPCSVCRCASGASPNWSAALRLNVYQSGRSGAGMTSRCCSVSYCADALFPR